MDVNKNVVTSTTSDQSKSDLPTFGNSKPKMMDIATQESTRPRQARAMPTNLDKSSPSLGHPDKPNTVHGDVNKPNMVHGKIDISNTMRVNIDRSNPSTAKSKVILWGTAAGHPFQIRSAAQSDMNMTIPKALELRQASRTGDVPFCQYEKVDGVCKFKGRKCVWLHKVEWEDCLLFDNLAEDYFQGEDTDECIVLMRRSIASNRDGDGDGSSLFGQVGGGPRNR